MIHIYRLWEQLRLWWERESLKTTQCNVPSVCFLTWISRKCVMCVLYFTVLTASSYLRNVITSLTILNLLHESLWSMTVFFKKYHVMSILERIKSTIHLKWNIHYVHKPWWSRAMSLIILLSLTLHWYVDFLLRWIWAENWIGVRAPHCLARPPPELQPQHPPLPTDTQLAGTVSQTVPSP